MITPKPSAADDSPSASTQARSVLIDRIKALIAANRWTQQHAASLCGLTQPRISDLQRDDQEDASVVQHFVSSHGFRVLRCTRRDAGC